MSILLTELSLHKITLSGEDQGDVHVTHGKGNVINPVKKGLEWKGKLHGALLWGTIESCSI